MVAMRSELSDIPHNCNALLTECVSHRFEELELQHIAVGRHDYGTASWRLDPAAESQGLPRKRGRASRSRHSAPATATQRTTAEHVMPTTPHGSSPDALAKPSLRPTAPAPDEGGCRPANPRHSGPGRSPGSGDLPEEPHALDGDAARVEQRDAVHGAWRRRARGCFLFVFTVRGFIPARAGAPVSRKVTLSDIGVHPRTRGSTGTDRFTEYRLFGSSPRAPDALERDRVVSDGQPAAGPMSVPSL